MNLRIQKLSDDAKVPTYAHVSDAGADVYCLEEVEIRAGERQVIPTGIALGIPSGHVVLIWDKSGISAKKRLKVMGGVIDSGYRGELFVTLENLGDQTQHFSKGDKVAQMVLQRVEHPDIEIVESLEPTDRGDGRLGSTGD